MVVENVHDSLIMHTPFAPVAALGHTFQWHMWPLWLLYAVTGGIFGGVLGYIFQRLTEQRLLVELLHREFELQVATLRHHYKNLAIGIQGFSERIRRKVRKLDECLSQCPEGGESWCRDFRGDIADLERNVNILQNAAERLSATLGQELSFLKAVTSETMAPQEADLHALIVSAVRDLLTWRFRDKDLQVEINGQPWAESQSALVFSFEPYTMEVILQNLLSNAMKFGDQIRIETRAAGDRVRLTVADNGPGIAVAELQEQLEAPPSHPARTSTRLGLKVSIHLVEKWGGALAVWSKPGAGATFVVELPKYPGGSRKGNAPKNP
jgi:signal transduction histidine kinase